VSLRRLVGIGVLEAPARLVGLRLETGGLDLDRGDALGGGCELLPQLDLGSAEPAQLGSELAAAAGTGVDRFAKRSFKSGNRDVECAYEAFDKRGAPAGQRILLEGIGGVGDRRVQPRTQLVEPGRERAPPRLQLEQERLGGLTGEPQLAPLGVEA